MSRYSHLLLINILILFIPNTGIHAKDTIQYRIGAITVASTGKNAPFWLTNNRYGMLTPAKYAVGMNILAQKKFDREQTKDYSWGVETAGRYDGRFQEKFYFPRAYLSGKYGFMIIRAGSKKEHFGNAYHPLSSGSLLWSQNARPIPKLAVHTDGYTDVPFTKGYLEFKGYYAEGILEKSRHVERPYVHYKHLYGRIGGNLPVHFHGGLQHAAMWGGKHPQHGQLSVNWEAYRQVFFGNQGTEATTDIEGEQINVLGNHLGSKNFGLDFENDLLSMGVYWQTIFEDGSGKSNRNQEDGLWGIYFESAQRRSLISSVCLEYIHTRHQSGPLHHLDDQRPIDSIVGGNDNYFNHYIYHSGWSYQKHTIGTPLITSPIYDVYQSMQEKNGDQIASYMPNNSVKAFHGGIKGWIHPKIAYTVYLTYTENYGIKHPDDDVLEQETSYEKKVVNDMGDKYYRLPGISQYSGMVGLRFPVKLWGMPFKVTTRLAFDYGTFYGTNFGCFIRISKHGFI